LRDRLTLLPALNWRMSDEERLRIACRAAAIGVWEWDIDSNEMVYTRIAREICGFTHAQPITLAMAQAVTHPDDIDRTMAQARRALDPELRDTSEFVYRIIRADTGAERWVRAYGEAQFELVNGVERAVSYVGSLQDITEEKAREDAVAESEARLRLAIDAGQMAVWEVDVGNDRVIGSPELNRLYGFPEDSNPTIDDFRSRYAPGERERLTEYGHKVLSEGGTELHSDIKHIWPDGTVKWLLMRAHASMNRDGDGLRVLGVVADITEKKKREEQVETVARELRHRLLNTFAIISALASRSWPDGHGTAKSDFQTRIAAIGKATELMFSRDDMLNHSVTLQQVLETITAPYRSAVDDPFVFEGPNVDVTEHTRSLAMAVHELSTNALKYGALSVPQGRVTLTWGVNTDGSLTIRWQEKFGPQVLQPTRSGFGTMLLEHMLFSPPNTVAIDYAEEGLTCVVTLRGCAPPSVCSKE